MRTTHTAVDTQTKNPTRKRSDLVLKSAIDELPREREKKKTNGILNVRPELKTYAMCVKRTPISPWYTFVFLKVRGTEFLIQKQNVMSSQLSSELHRNNL